MNNNESNHNNNTVIIILCVKNLCLISVNRHHINQESVTQNYNLLWSRIANNRVLKIVLIIVANKCDVVDFFITVNCYNPYHDKVVMVDDQNYPNANQINEIYWGNPNNNKDKNNENNCNPVLDD